MACTPVVGVSDDVRVRATGEELEGELRHVALAPTASGILEVLARRPDYGEREVLESAVLDEVEGLVGDSWHWRYNTRTPDGRPDPLGQLNVMCSRSAALIAGSSDRDRWVLAGDQLYIDVDLSEAGTPAGTRFAIGEAEIEITAKPHRGCPKFTARFGDDALRLVNSEVGVALNLRGRNARVTRGGTIHVGDPVERVER
jgi:hypothetical protein